MRRTRGPAVVGCSMLVCILASSTPSVAEGGGADGRLQGDVTLVAGLGPALVVSPAQGLSQVYLRARYLQTAGVVAAYEEAEAWQGPKHPGSLRRSWSTGVELRPLFPGLFLKNMETGTAWFDLTLSSLGLDLGVTWSERHEVSSAGPGLYAGAAIELPLMATATGLWLRLSGQGRWSHAALTGEDQPGQAVAVLGVALAWHHVIDAHVATLGDHRLE